MDVERLSPVSRDLLEQARRGQLVNELYRDGARLDGGFERERRCFALGERGWLRFLGWEGRPHEDADCLSRWALTPDALDALAQH